MISKELIREYMNHCRYKKNYSNRTLYEYQNDLILILAFLNRRKYGEDAKLEAIEIEGIDEYVTYCKEQKLKGSTINRKISVLNGYLKYHHLKYHVPLEKYECAVPKQQTSYEYLKKGECEILFQGLGPKLYYRNRAIILLILETGIKVKELYRLNYDKTEGKMLTIGERVVKLSPPMRKALKEYYNNERGREAGALFLGQTGTRLTPRSIQYMLESACERSQLYKRVTPEVLRQTYIVRQYNEGKTEKEIQKELNLKEPIKLSEIKYL